MSAMRVLHIVVSINMLSLNDEDVGTIVRHDRCNGDLWKAVYAARLPRDGVFVAHLLLHLQYWNPDNVDRRKSDEFAALRNLYDDVLKRVDCRHFIAVIEASITVPLVPWQLIC